MPSVVFGRPLCLVHSDMTNTEPAGAWTATPPGTWSAERRSPSAVVKRSSAGKFLAVVLCAGCETANTGKSATRGAFRSYALCDPGMTTISPSPGPLSVSIQTTLSILECTLPCVST